MREKKRLKLGWLFPYSGIFRNLKKDLQQGLDLALQKEGVDWTIDPYPEFVQTGALNVTEDALKKLLLFEQVDLVAGVMSTKVALGVLPFIEDRKTPVIFMNLGADIPARELNSGYLFYNSLHLWKSEWVMGKWAQEKYGGEPSINMSIYEGGYGLHDSFRTGTAASGAETVKLNIIKNISATPDTGPLIDYLRQQQPEHTHVLLSGKEGQQFLQLFHDHGLGSRMGLTVNPFMTEEEVSPELPAGLCLHNAMTWSPDLDKEDNRSFVHQYTASYEEPPNAFSLLAYETGLALASAMRGLPAKIDREGLAEALKKVKAIGPRGMFSLSTSPLQTRLPVYIRQPVKDPGTGKMENRILEEYTGIEWDDPSLPSEQSYLTGWQNPYLCL